MPKRIKESAIGDGLGFASQAELDATNSQLAVTNQTISGLSASKADAAATSAQISGLTTSKANQSQVDSIQSAVNVFQAGQLSGLTGADALALLAIGVDTNGNTYATPTDRIKAIESAVSIKGKNLKGTLVINSNTVRIPYAVTKGVKTSITFTYSISATPTHMYLSTQSSPDGGTTFVYEQQYLQDFTSNISTQQTFEFIPLKDAAYITFNLTNVAWTGTLTYEFKGSGLDASVETKDLLFDGDLNFTYKQPVDLGFVKKGDMIKIELWSYVGSAYRISYMETTSTYQQIVSNGSAGIYTYSSQFASLYSFRYLLVETINSSTSYTGHLRVTRINDDSVYAYQNNRSYLKEKSESFKMASLGDSITSDQVTGLGTSVPSYLNWTNVGNFAIGSAVCADKSDTTDNLTTPANAFASINVLSNQVKRLLQNTTALGAQVTWTVEGTAYSISTSVGTGLGNITQIPEIIYIAIGTNDSVYTDDVDTVLEQPYSALTRQTIGSALRWAIQTLQTVYPYAQIFVNSPMQTQQTGNQFTWSNQKTKRGIIKKVCEAMAVEFIDSYAESGFNRYNATFYATEIGIHPSKYIGKPIMTRYLANRLKNSAIKKYMLDYTQD